MRDYRIILVQVDIFIWDLLSVTGIMHPRISFFWVQVATDPLHPRIHRA